jgi:hypothetical protein
VARSSEHGNKSAGCIKCWGILLERLVASEDGLGSLELVSWLLLL